MSLSPVPLAGGAVLVQSHVVMPLRVRVLVERGGVRVVPVLFKLLSENTFPCELLLHWGRGGRRKRYVSKKKEKILLFLPLYYSMVFLATCCWLPWEWRLCCQGWFLWVRARNWHVPGLKGLWRRRRKEMEGEGVFCKGSLLETIQGCCKTLSMAARCLQWGVNVETAVGPAAFVCLLCRGCPCRAARSKCALWKGHLPAGADCAALEWFKQRRVPLWKFKAHNKIIHTVTWMKAFLRPFIFWSSR